MQQVDVSTLTQPDGWMPLDSIHHSRVRHHVSTLTLPEGRMPRTPVHRLRTHRRCFNPHPARRPDATPHPSAFCLAHRCFNPHPVRRLDATLLGAERPLVLSEEQNTMKYTVSILTQPEGWMPVPHQVKHHVCFNPHPAQGKVPTAPGVYPSILVSVTPSGIAASSTMTL